MARFSGNWEKEFRPQWELGNPSKGAVGAASDPRANPCSKCVGRGRVTCYQCGGLGTIINLDGKKSQCFICVGAKDVGCGYCRGTGKSTK